MAKKLTKTQGKDITIEIRKTFEVETITTGKIGIRRDNRYKSDRNNRQSESNNRDPNRRRRNTSSKNDRTNERNHNSKKDRPSQNNSLTDINMQANEQTNFDRQDVKRDDLEDKLDMAANNFNQNRVEETQKVDTLRDSAHSDSNQSNFDQQKKNNENSESNEGY